MTVMLAALASTAGPHGEPVAVMETACDTPASPADAVRKAFLFAFPLYEMTRTRQRMLKAPGAKSNMLLHRASLSRPSDRSITMPNHDTLYSTAWLDLADGAIEFSIPPMRSRYHSAALMNAFSDTVAILRNESEATRTFMIVGPHWDGEAVPGQVIVRSPTRDAWLVVRTFVGGATDLVEAQRVQQSFGLVSTGHGAGAEVPDATISIEPDAVEFLSVVKASLARGPLPDSHRDRLGCHAAPGISPGAAALDPEMRQLWDSNLARFQREAGAAFESAGSLHDGWRYPAGNIAVFGTDDLYRSAMATGGLAAMPLEEAINPVAAADADGKPLSGSFRYQLRIPGDVPVDAFWSLTLYESGEAGRWYLHDNPLGRYAIGSHTPDVHRAADGSISVDISHRPPRDAANWLPAPNGNFLLVFRAYRPRQPLIDGTFRLPPVHRVSRRPRPVAANKPSSD